MERKVNPSLCKAAITYSEKFSFSVIPVRPDKKPYIKWELFQKRRATNEEITAWWNRWPNAMIGIVTGKISGVVVIDIDSHEGEEAIQEFIPETLVMPICQTPKGGQHLYFKSPEKCPSNNARLIPGCDFRGEGGYVIAPPSMKGAGKAYAWLDGLSIEDVAPAELPEPYILKINSFLYSKPQNDRPHEATETTNDHKMFEYGRRDEDLFHAANCLVKGGMPDQEISQILERLILSWGENPDQKWITTKIESAFKRASRREGTIAAEVKEWVETTNGHFLTTECHKELQLTTKTTIKAANMALLRLCEEGVIERYGNRRGLYRLVQHDAEVIDFLNAPDKDFEIDLPLDLSKLCIIYPGSPIIVAGTKGAGKTAFALDVVKRNMRKHEVVYLTSELHSTELKKRLSLHGDLSLRDWNFRPLRVHHDWSDYISPEPKIFVIDYIEEVQGEAWRVGAHIKAVHDKLDKGVAVICLQKKADSDLARGGAYTLDKARLYVGLDKGKAKIVDAKAFRRENPNGMVCDFKLVQGWEFLPEGDWHK